LHEDVRHVMHVGNTTCRRPNTLQKLHVQHAQHANNAWMTPQVVLALEKGWICFSFKKHTQTAKLWGLGVEAAYYGHLNLVEYFVEKSGAEPSKVRSLTLEVSLTHSFFHESFQFKKNRMR